MTYLGMVCLKKILCPEGVYRKSLAYYYVSPLESKPSDNKIGAK